MSLTSSPLIQLTGSRHLLPDFVRGVRMRHRIASATTSIAACSLFTFICSFGVAAYSADGPEGKASNGDASATSAADHKSGAKSTQIDRQLRKVGSWRNIDSIVRTWGSITGPKIYFSDAAHASSAQGLLADICPGDDRHVRFLVQIDVNNLKTTLTPSEVQRGRPAATRTT